MTFVVYDYGIRTQTPWYDVLPPRRVDQTVATAAVPALSRNDQVHGAGAAPQERPAPRNPYQQEAEPPARRQRVVLVAELMSQPVQTLTETATLLQAWQQLSAAGIQHLPVLTAAGTLGGLVTALDLLRSTSVLATAPGARPRLLTTSVSEIMTRQVIVARPDTEVRLLAAAMNSHHIGCMPVLDDGETLVGIVTRSDLLRVLGNHEPLDLWG